MAFNQRILLIEDSPEVQILIERALRSKYSVSIVSTAAAAGQALEKENYELILLDIELPDGSGFDLCNEIRMDAKLRDIPLIIVSGKTSTSDKVRGLNLGADDYISKPIEVREFQARVDAHLRRRNSEVEAKGTLSIGPFRANFTQLKMYVTDGPGGEAMLDLTPLEFKIFYYLMQNEGQTLSRDQILNSVWGQLAHVTDRTVDSHIYTLRRKLGAHAKMIRSVPRFGYCFSQKKIEVA